MGIESRAEAPGTVEKSAKTVRNVGLVLSVIGLFGIGSLVMPGLLAAGGGWAVGNYEEGKRSR